MASVGAFTNRSAGTAPLWPTPRWPDLVPAECSRPPASAANVLSPVAFPDERGLLRGAIEKTSSRVPFRRRTKSQTSSTDRADDLRRCRTPGPGPRDPGAVPWNAPTPPSTGLPTLPFVREAYDRDDRDRAGRRGRRVHDGADIRDQLPRIGAPTAIATRITACSAPWRRCARVATLTTRALHGRSTGRGCDVTSGYIEVWQLRRGREIAW